MTTTATQRVVACVIRRGDRYLICQRPHHKRHGGLWEFPGGKVEAGESDGEAARRELHEELDLVLSADPESAVFEARDPGSPFVVAFVPVQVVGEPGGDEYPAIQWATLVRLESLPLAPSDHAFVQWLKGDQHTEEP